MSKYPKLTNEEGLCVIILASIVFIMAEMW